MKKAKEAKSTYSAKTVSVVTARGNTAIPRVLRERYRVTAKSRLQWIDTGEGMLVVPLAEKPQPRKAEKSNAIAPIPKWQQRYATEAEAALDIARRAGLLAELPAEAKVRAAEWRALPEAERKKISDEFFHLKLDQPLSDIILENRR